MTLAYSQARKDLADPDTEKAVRALATYWGGEVLRYPPDANAGSALKKQADWSVSNRDGFVREVETETRGLYKPVWGLGRFLYSTVHVPERKESLEYDFYLLTDGVNAAITTRDKVKASPFSLVETIIEDDFQCRDVPCKDFEFYWIVPQSSGNTLYPVK